jgi:streptogramin lyase
MNNKRLISVSTVLVAVLALRGPVLAALGAQETPLSPFGEAFEINPDPQGELWVSDASAGEIWSFDATGGARTVYRVGGTPSDARSDGAGSVWWADFESNKLGRLSTSADQAIFWEIPGSTSLYSTAIDSSGDVWVSESFGPFIYKLDPDTNQLCTYELPSSGVTDYLHVYGRTLWFGDVENSRLVRLQDGAFDWWVLPSHSYPQDLELDENGQLWWTDSDRGYLGRLDSVTATMTTFTPPLSGAPAMLTLFGGRVWISQQGPGRVLELDPAVASSQTAAVTTGSKAATPACSLLSPLTPFAVTATSSQVSWTGQTYATELDAGGWVAYRMPVNSAPWGIAASGQQVWLVDQGRQVLARLGASAQSYQIYLPLARRG